MAVTLDVFRMRVGTYNLSGTKKTRVFRCKAATNMNMFVKLSHNQKRKLNWKEQVLCAVLYTIVALTVVNNSASIGGNNVCHKQITSTCKILENMTTSEQTVILHGWGSGLSINKLCHIKNGNKRRNIGYKYFTWNCDRGLLSQNKIEDIKMFASKHKPHFMAISEIDLRRNENNVNENSSNVLSTEQVHEKFKIEGYRIILPPSWLIHDKARIFVFVNEELNVKVRQVNQSETHLQNVLLEAGYGKSKTHLIDFYYREWKNCVTGDSDLASQLNDLSLLTDIWRRCTAEDKDFIALGDINLCAKQWDEPGYVHAQLAEIVKDFMMEENCCQVVDGYTRMRMVDGNIQRSCLDHIIVNCVDKISNLEIHGVGKSDHMGLIINKFSREVRTCTKTTRKRVYKNFDCERFVEDIREAKQMGKFDQIHATEDIEEAGDTFTEAFCEVLNKHAPLKVIQNRNGYQPYISSVLKDKMDKRDAFKEEAAETGDNTIYRKYQDLRNEVTADLKTAESDHYKKKFNDPDCTPNEAWKMSYQILGKHRSDFPSQMMFGNQLLSKPSQIASAMNDFFLSKISNLKSNFFNNDDHSEELHNFLEGKAIPGFSLSEITEGDMRKIIKKMKGKRSCGLDWICGFTLKLAAPELIPEMTALINISIRSGKFYSKWKRSKVLPGYKSKGSKFDCKFYRPISNLPELSKIQERVVHNQLYDYLSSNHLIHPNHHGFLQHHSTTTALHQIVDTWLQAADRGKLSATLLLDLKAGFDVIEHSILISKLKEYGLSEVTISWFENYLENRSQCVQIESSISELKHVPWGVPQGSILGPLLFIIFINELPQVVKSSENQEEDTNIIIYADDNSPTTSNNDPMELLRTIERDGTKVTDWFSRNKMVCSGEKTKLLVSGTRANRQSKIDFTPEIVVCNDTITESSSEKLLGVIVNNNITWKNHLFGNEEELGLIKNLSKRIGMLRKLRKYLPNEKFKQTVSAIFSSKLCYCITVWGGVWNLPGDLSDQSRRNMSISKDEMRKLQVMQNKCLRMITNLDRSTPTATLLQKTGFLSVHQTVAHQSAVQVFNVLKHQAPAHHYQRLFPHLVHGQGENMEMRSVTNLNTRVEFSGALGRSSFFFQSSKIWNALPMSMKTAGTTQSFKTMCKKWTRENITIRP